MKKILALMLVLALVVVCFVGCTTTADAPDDANTSDDSKVDDADDDKTDDNDASGESYKFVFNCTTTDNEYFSDVAAGCKEYCDANGIAFTFEGCDFDAAKQVDAFENYISAGYNAIMCCPVDPASLEDVIKKAQDKGIVVIGQAQGIDIADGNSIVDDYEYGVNLAKAAIAWIEKYFPGEEVEAALLTLDGVEQTKLRGDGMQKTLEDAGVKIVNRQIAETAEQGASVAETILTANPNLEVIVCVNDNAAIGAWQAVDAAGKITDRFYIGGGDYTSAIVPYLEDADCAIRCSVNILPKQSGIDCATMAHNILTGKGEGSTMYFQFDPTYQEGTMD